MTTIKLIDQNTGKEVKVGDAVVTFRGDIGTVQAIHAPRHSGSSGKVTVAFPGEHEPQCDSRRSTVDKLPCNCTRDAWACDYYPQVLGCRIQVV